MPDNERIPVRFPSTRSGQVWLCTSFRMDVDLVYTLLDAFEKGAARSLYYRALITDQRGTVSLGDISTSCFSDPGYYGLERLS